MLPITPLYRLPHGQYGYRGHAINLPQDVASFANTLPRLPTELDIIVVRKEGSIQSHRDSRVRRSVVLQALQWLVANNSYYRNVHIDPDALAQLPEDGDLAGLHFMTVDSPPDDSEVPAPQDIDPYDADLSRTFVPVTARRLTNRKPSDSQCRSDNLASHLQLHGHLLVTLPSMSLTPRVTSLVPSQLCFHLVQLTL